MAAKQYLEVDFKVRPKAFYLESEQSRKFFVDSIAKFGWTEYLEYTDKIFDIFIQNEESSAEIEMSYGEWLVIYEDNSAQWFTKEEFESRFKTR